MRAGETMDLTSTFPGHHTEDPLIFLNALESPAFLMQAEPRQIVTANRKACELFDKDLSHIEKFRGGQVFDCVHAFTDAGCGKDIHCENCKIKNVVVETFATGRSHHGIQTILEITRHNETMPYDLQVSTQKIGSFVIVIIDTFKKRM